MTIEIIGRAALAPGASSVEELKQLLAEGRCSVTEVPRERWELARFWHPVQATPGKTYTYAAGVLNDIYHFDPAVFGLSQREAMQMDPQQRILLNLVWRALEDANLPAGLLSNERVGVFVGASSLDNANLSVEDPASGSPYFMTGNTLSIVSNRISHVFGLRGPSMTIDTACSSSLVALDQAARALERGEIDTAIVGGVNLLAHPLSFVGFAQARMLSPEGLCRAYDTNGHGYVRAEGGVAMIMRRSDRALRERDHSYARLHGTGVNSAGRTNGISLPSREAQAALLDSIYEGCGIDVNRVAFIEGHGTGTRVGDPAEVWAIGTVIGKNRRAPVPIGSIKSNIGHTEPASGLFGLLKAMLALENNFLPASLHIEATNEDIDFEGLNVRVNTAGIELLPAKSPRFAGVNSFGFGGTNAHVVISDPDPVVPPEPQLKGDGPIFLASAHSQSALSSLLEDYRQRLAGADRKEARQIVASAAANREPMRHRFAVKAKDAESVLRALEAQVAGESGAGEVGEAPGQAARIAFFFAGNGSQFAGMGADAYRENPHFRQCFLSFSALFEYYLGEKLTDILVAEDLGERLIDTKIAQPLLFAVQAALSDCLVAQGIKPDVVFGHSVGEVAAAYAAKALTAAEAVAIIAKRSQHQDLLAGEGKMAAVVLNEEAALAFARSNGLNEICIAAINAPNSVTISGPSEEIKAFRDLARKAQIVAHVLDINYPFHHPIIDRAKDAFLGDLPNFEPESGAITFISTVTGKKLDGSRLDAAYWWRNVRDPVLWKQASQVAMDEGCNLFIEISPRPILSNYVVETARSVKQQIVAIPTLLRESGTGRDPVAQSVARAVAHGVAIRPRGNVARNAFIKLPPLPFEPVELRPAPTSDEIDIFGRDERTPYTLLGWRTDPNAAGWKNHVDAHLFPDLAEHVVDSKAIMPGSGFIEIAVEAARQYFGSALIEITNLEIMRPLELRQDRVQELSTLLSPETGNIEIRSRERLSHDDWTVHAVARARRPLEEAFIEAPRQSSREVVEIMPAEPVYQTAESFGLHYGPRFRLLQKATAFADRHIEVELRAPAAAAHPYLTYQLNPMSVDAAFHGLVALFGELSGDETGAPYIPVRFGSIRVAASRSPIRRASIQIERFSRNSIKVRFRLFDEEGTLVAALDDCRFRRTYLRRHHSLESVGFHYETVPSASFPPVAGRPALDVTRMQVGTPGGEVQLANATLLLDAAVYRACHEIALAVADRNGVISDAALPAEPGLRAFVVNCLFSLEDAGIARSNHGGWTVPTEFTLPSVDELLRDLYGEDAGRVAEAVLVNNAYHDALERLSRQARRGQDDDRTRKTVSEATLDHVLVHSPLSLEKLNRAVEQAEAVLAASKGSTRFVLELGSASTAHSRRLSQLVAEAGAALIIAEPRENLRRALEMTFEQDPHVTVVDPDGLAGQPIVDLTIAAGDQSLLLLASNEAVETALQRSSGQGGTIIFADRAPSVFSDFVFGLGDDWFAKSQSPDFPVGRLATSAQVQDLCLNLGFSQCSAKDISTSAGNLIVATAAAKVAKAGTALSFDQEAPLVLIYETEKVSPGALEVLAVRADAGRPALMQLFNKLADQPLQIVYLAQRTADDNVSSKLQARLQHLAAIAEAVAASEPSGNAPRRAMLTIVAPGGAPLTSAVIDVANAGLWPLARVVQNEYDLLDVHLVDTEIESARLGHAISGILAAKTSNREWILGSDGNVTEIRAVNGPQAAGKRLTRDFEAATIRQQAAGRLDSLIWEGCPTPVTKPGEVVVAVEAAGLNFRDVMWAMGLLPEEALEDGFAGATIGMEFSGRVTEIGGGVTDLAVGDRVMGIGPAAFSTHVRVRRDGVTKAPPQMSADAAATVPVVFLTAFYAMVELGNIRQGETILIHGAAGGVGLAALQIAQMKGAKVIATAGTVEKRRFLTALGADHVFDSRSLDFVSEVRSVTGGEGVDLVLNSLFSEAMERSLELVKPFGRFLELGKRDYYSDRKIGLRPFRRNISYFGIDADQLLVNVPDLTKRIFEEIGALFATEQLKPIPFRAFAFDEIGTAFRLMQNAGHIGKIVIRPPVAGEDAVNIAQDKPLGFDSEGVFLVAGGIGGFGLSAADWLVSSGVRKIALCSRRGQADKETLEAVARWKRRGVSASLHACDITDKKATADLLAELREKGKIKGIIHAAMVLDDALLSNLTAERNRPVVEVKVRGAENLDRLSQEDDLELFLLFSSVTTMLGNPGQANYVAANGYLEGLARRRRAEGRPALAVGFGAIADKGYLARNAEVNEVLSKRVGKSALRAREALQLVEAYMRSDSGAAEDAVVAIAEVDWAAARMVPIANTALFGTIMRQAGSQQAAGDSDGIDLEALIAGKSEEEAQIALHRLLAAEIAAILRVTEDSVTPDKVLKDIGLDSLMAMELGMSFQQKTGFDIPLSSMGEGTTVGEIVARLRERIVTRNGAAQQGETETMVSQLLTTHAGGQQKAAN